MSRQNEWDRRHRGWRDLVLAGAAAGAVTLLLIAAVGLVWLLGRSPTQAPVLAVQSQSTPTPRALTFVRNTPTPPAAAPADVPTATAVAPVEESVPAPTVVATPELLAMSTESEATPTSDGGDGVIFEAPGRNELEPLASGSWSASADALVNEGSSAVAEPWLIVSAVPSTTFAVEAEIRVNGLLESVCDQSFGLTAGSPGADQMYGGGLIFPCAAETPRARLTDVSVWEDGYNADPVLAEQDFDPGDDWHTYRFELRIDELRLLVDGADVVSGTLDAPIDPSVADAQAGLWAQGVGLEVRKVSVQSLPPG